MQQKNILQWVKRGFRVKRQTSGRTPYPYNTGRRNRTLTTETIPDPQSEHLFKISFGHIWVNREQSNPLYNKTFDSLVLPIAQDSKIRKGTHIFLTRVMQKENYFFYSGQINGGRSVQEKITFSYRIIGTFYIHAIFCGCSST